MVWFGMSYGLKLSNQKKMWNDRLNIWLICLGGITPHGVRKPSRNHWSLDLFLVNIYQEKSGDPSHSGDASLSGLGGRAGKIDPSKVQMVHVFDGSSSDPARSPHIAAMGRTPQACSSDMSKGTASSEPHGSGETTCQRQALWRTIAGLRSLSIWAYEMAH